MAGMADHKYPQITPAPNWDEIFKRRPDLEAPGYRETVELMRSSGKTEPHKSKP